MYTYRENFKNLEKTEFSFFSLIQSGSQLEFPLG